MKKLLTAILLLSSYLIVNAQTWSALGPGTDGPIISLGIYNNNLCAGKEFVPPGYPAYSLDSWNGSTWSTIGNGINSETYFNVYALQAYQNSLIVGGDFDTAGSLYVNCIASWNSTSWSSLGNGINVYSINGDGVIKVLDTAGSKLYVGGSFDTAGGTIANNIAMWDGSNWYTLGKGITGNAVNAISEYQGNLYAAGWFDSAGGIVANNIAMWDGSSWSAVGSSANHGQINALCIFNNTLIAGGFFSKIGGVTANNIAAWNGTSWTPLGTGLYGAVYSLTTYNGNLYAGGIIDSAGGIKVQNIATWNGTSWSSVGGGVGRYDDTDAVYAMTVWQGSLYAGGFFGNAGGISANNIAKWTTPVGINEIETGEAEVNVFPNPSNGIFNFQYSGNDEKCRLEVYNILGEEVYEQKITSAQQSTINLSAQAKGLYLYRVISSTGSVIGSGKLVTE